MFQRLLPKGAIALTLFLVSACGTTTTMSHMNHGTQTQASVSGAALAGTDTSVPTEEVAKGGKLEVTLTAAESQVPFRDSTRWAMTYNGAITGPTIRIHPGDQLTINLVNNLSKPTSLHTHGLHVDPAVDDPFLMVEPGQSHKYVYDIPSNQRPGIYWYHPHVHQLTAEQVASGLSGAIVVEAANDSLKAATTDRVLVINDPLLVTQNPWTGEGNGVGGMGSMMGGSNPNPSTTSDTAYGRGVNMMQSMAGRTGQLLLTNGFEGVNFTQSAGKLERLEIVNATASTQLHFTYEGKQLYQLSTGGGRLVGAVPTIDSIDLGPGDRTEVVLVPKADGGKLFAQRVSNEAGNAVSTTKELIASVAANAGTDTAALPMTLDGEISLFGPNIKVAQTRTITLDGHMTPKIDGKLFDPNTVNFTAKKGTVEEWVIKSNSPMSHPFHLHTWGFQIQGEPGWHDEVTVLPNQSVTIRVSFDDFTGTTVLHCHILDHEDTGMMAIIKVS